MEDSTVKPTIEPDLDIGCAVLEVYVTFLKDEGWHSCKQLTDGAI
jgi:hypothetical protein